jgi:hypothetical protein
MRTLALVVAASFTVSSPLLAQTAPAPTAPAVDATAADFTAGAAVRSSDNSQVGKIDSVLAEKSAAVIDTGDTKVAVPFSMFKKDANGIIMTITAGQFADARAKAHARTEAEKAAEQVPQASKTPDGEKSATPPK